MLTRDIFITDTTFRDGQQARPPYTIDQMVHIYDLLSKLSGPQGVIRQTEFFLYTANDRKTLDRCRELGHRYPECTGWIRADKGDFRLVREAGLKETGRADELLGLPHLQQAEVQEPAAVHRRLLRNCGCRVRGRHSPALPSRRHHAKPISAASCCRSSLG